MQRLAIELVDAGVTSVDDRGRMTGPSPAVAIADRDEIVVGRDAAARARLHPRHLHSRFWQDLATEGLSRPFPEHLRTADLAHAHLSRVWRDAGLEDAQVLLAVPGVMSRAQLGLLLGIAEACDMTVVGLVDVAVAAAAGRPTRPRCLHLDIHLHRAVLTVLSHGVEVRRELVVEDQRIGLASLHDGWARAVAGKFVTTTRFDPLLAAATEQALYSQLPAHLRSLRDRQAIEIAMSSGGRRHAIDFELAEATAAAAGYAALLDLVQTRTGGAGTTLLLSDRTAGLPGLGDLLAPIDGLEVVELHPAAAASSALDLAARIAGEGPALRLVTALPGFDDTPRGAQTVAAEG